ncbi:MAG: L,D-transpeptidase [Clostridia bacterium]|nr:L,D-transpeptidase [Clostridia bacterium]
MNGSKNDSKRILIALISLCVMVAFLSVFTVTVYRGKRNGNEDLIEEFETGLISEDTTVSKSDLAELSSQEEVSSEDNTVSEVSSAADTGTVSDTVADTASENYIINPDNKSEFYMVVFTGNQCVLVYKKNKNGEYKIKFHMMLCSTGAAETPTKEGVYSITKKEKWIALSDGAFGQYGCALSGEQEYIISSTPFAKKKAWTMLDGGYENIGKAGTKGNIQLCVRDARWIYVNMPVDTQVHVVNAENPDMKELTLPKRKNSNGGWDPTDKWAEGNPYFG